MLTQDGVVYLVTEVETLSVCEVLQEEAVNLKTLVKESGSSQGELELFTIVQ